MNLNKIGFFGFNIGIFLLFSAPAIASFFLIISLLISIFLIKKNPLHDKINLFLILISFLMLLSWFLYQFNSDGKYPVYESNLSTDPLIGLINWIPLFLSYIGFQHYLRTKNSRLICGLSLMSGSIPILISGFGQYLFNWYGPLEFLNGLIIWYQRDNTSGMTSFFNNPNYAACSLACILPLFYATFYRNKTYKLRKIINLIIIFLIIIGILFTSSRNGLLGIFLGAFFFFISLRSKLLTFSLLSFSSIFLFDLIFKYAYGIALIPLNLTNRISLQEFYEDPRLLIWKNSIFYIFKKPFLGWGGNSFSYLWNKDNTLYLGHSHSIPLEISIQYGLITSLLLSSVVVFILLKSFRVIFLDLNFKLRNSDDEFHFDRGWFAACVVILFSNLIDILYFDVRISILTWVLLAGLRNIPIREDK
ncbi:O-antigen ligase family protein [Prochlorococcus marinus]|uniref:O-antigen ligase family protein n=1 Tax=Prochlorococcus marinus TaxID=1219 RepID=UPI001C5A4EE9|nr:O-antigen ligase family protein [Prochlorococcus marinus]